MSQDQPPQPEPEKIEPQTPVPKPETVQAENTFQQLTQSLQQTWRQAQPVIKAQSIKALRSTIDTLEGVVEKLEEPPSSPPEAIAPTPDPSNPPQTTTQAKQRPATPFSLGALLSQLQPRLQQLQTLWNGVLTKIRTRLPESLNQKLSNSALTGAIAGVLVVLLWTTSAILPGPKEVAKVPPAQQVPPELTAPPELSVPEIPQPVEEISPTTAETPSAEPSPPVAVPSPEVPVVASPPPMELTPEQSLIAAIQNQVAEISDQYANGLIQSIQANFQGSRLIVKVGNGWYSLDRPQQDKLANEMLARAQELDFSRLELTDTVGNLLARSPVVGSNMVILKRQTQAEVG